VKRRKIDQAALVDDLTSTWLAGLQGADGAKARQLAGELVADWAREADSMPDPAAVVRYQREDLEAMATNNGGDWLRALDLELLQRRVNQLSATTFKLAQAALERKIGADASARQGRALLEQCEQYAADLDRLGSDEATTAIRRVLNEAMLDALYAVERKAMSHRLARYGPQAGTDPVEGGPPRILPPPDRAP